MKCECSLTYNDPDCWGETQPLVCKKHKRILIGKKKCVECTQEPEEECENAGKLKQFHNQEGMQMDWEDELRLKLDDIFEDAHSYTGPNIDETFDRVFVFTKQFIADIVAKSRKDTIEEIKAIDLNPEGRHMTLGELHGDVLDQIK